MNTKEQYRAYLGSEEWKEFKRLKLVRTPKRCSICSSTASVALHHLFYRWPWTEALLSDTRWLCELCHTKTHELIKSGVLTFPKPDNHGSCFALTKTRVKMARGFGMKNLFYPKR